MQPHMYHLHRHWHFSRLLTKYITAIIILMFTCTNNNHAHNMPPYMQQHASVHATPYLHSCNNILFKPAQHLALFQLITFFTKQQTFIRKKTRSIVSYHNPHKPAHSKHNKIKAAPLSQQTKTKQTPNNIYKYNKAKQISTNTNK